MSPPPLTHVARFAAPLISMGLALCLACCTPGGVSGGAPEGAPLGIVVLPGDVTLTMEQGKTTQQAYRAYGYFDAAPPDGGHAAAPPGGVEITDKVTWAVANPSMGRFSGSTLRTEVSSGGKVSSASQGGITEVIATYKEVTGRARLRVVYRLSVLSPKAPADSASRFGGGAVPKRAPKIVYPTSGVLLPPNLHQLEIHWDKGSGNDLFLVKIVSPLMELKLYTTWNTYNLTGPLWRTVANTNRDGQVTVQVQGTSKAKPGGKGISKNVTIKFGKQDLKGGLYFWVVEEGGSILRYDFDKPTAKAEPYYTAKNEQQCVGCHVISRSGNTMAFVRKGGDGQAAIIDVKSSKPIIDSKYKANFQTFSPDGKEVIVSFNGKLTRREVATGKVLEQVPTQKQRASHPDWSPNGTTLAFAFTDLQSFVSDVRFKNGSIAVITRSGGKWSAPKTLVQCGGGTNCYYPSFSPLGDWILYNRSTGDTYSDEDANVYVVKSTGGTPIALGRVNGHLVSNSWPRWSPFIQQYKGGTIFWLTFSSVRDYGLKLKNSVIKEYEAKAPQIWMTAFDLKVAKSGKDPTSPPFWLPFQGSTHNHLAQWTEKIISIK